ncbi:SusC/RagA family TonB-linked outer membrane protein [Sphingobacterium sp. Mn56C]|uniref:SusC/RagA family TonB-linked outer membrane protein n=1 Tax=Sphingobacterium sp. Mn56C TaxID=3395261 RepID=UPI003BCBBCB3
MIKNRNKPIFLRLIGTFVLSVPLGMGLAAPQAIAAPVSVLKSKAQQQQQQIVRGMVVNELGEPLAGVSLRLIKASAGSTVLTDSKGNFSLPANLADDLLISHVGYVTQTYRITASAMQHVVLRMEDTVLEETVVIGYGTTTRKAVVGAVDQIKAAQLENRPVANVTQALQGASPSLTIQQKSMDPNDNAMNVNIRGISTMNSNGPLVVIDGLVSDIGAMNKMNPMDIESVSVLKDAGTAAIYGSRSANGVILVTTKQGKRNQRPTVKLSSLAGVQDPRILFAPVKGYQNAVLRNQALTNVGKPPEFTPDQVLDLFDHRDVEKWNYNEIIQRAFQHNHTINVSGGSEYATYLFSGGFVDQRSNFVGNENFGIQRFNLRSNVSATYGIFKLGTILAYSRNNSLNHTASNAIINASRLPSYYYYGMQAPNGKYLINNALTDQNPLAELQEGGYQKYDNDYFNANVSLDVNLAKGLKLRGVFGSEIYADHRFIRRIQVPLYSSADASSPSVYVNPNRNTEDFNEKATRLNYQLLLDYDRTFNAHAVKLLFGATNESYTRRQNEIKLRFTDPILGTPTTGTIIDPGSRTSLNGTYETSITSLIGRAAYSYADRYFAEGTFRYDGSSRFAKENRWGLFPSLSLGWRMSEEDFFAAYRDRVGDLKLRASYGILGNQDIPAYQYLTVYQPYTNTYGFNNKPVVGAGFTYANNDLRWEKTRNFNVGLDASFFRNKLTASFDYFIKNTVDILLTPEITSVFGTRLSKTNIGEMRNQGWELVLNYRTETGKFKHNFAANIGDSFNKVLNFQGKESIQTSDGISKIIREGLPYNVYYGYKVKGYFRNIQELETAALPVGINAGDLQPGDVQYVDRNNDGIIDANDRFVLGNGFPRYTFGFSYDVTFKDFDFSMFWQGVGKRDMMVRGELVEPFHENYSYAIYQHQLDFWTPTHMDAQWPRLTAAGGISTQNNYRMGSDLYLFNGRYARLKNIQIGYSLPKHFTDKIKLQRARVFVNAQNLLTLSFNSWIDPESSEFDGNMGGSANSARNYPTLKYYGFGLDIQF